MKKNIVYGIVIITVIILVTLYFTFSSSEKTSNENIDNVNNDVIEGEVKNAKYYNTEDGPLKPSEYLAIEDKKESMNYYISATVVDSGYWDSCDISVLPCTDISELPPRNLYVEIHDLRIFYKANDMSEVGGWKDKHYYLFEIKPILEPIILPGTNKPYDINAAELVSAKYLTSPLDDGPIIGGKPL